MSLFLSVCCALVPSQSKCQSVFHAATATQSRQHRKGEKNHSFHFITLVVWIEVTGFSAFSTLHNFTVFYQHRICTAFYCLLEASLHSQGWAYILLLPRMARLKFQWPLTVCLSSFLLSDSWLLLVMLCTRAAETCFLLAI